MGETGTAESIHLSKMVTNLSFNIGSQQNHSSTSGRGGSPQQQDFLVILYLYFQPILFSIKIKKPTKNGGLKKLFFLT